MPQRLYVLLHKRGFWVLVNPLGCLAATPSTPCAQKRLLCRNRRRLGHLPGGARKGCATTGATGPLWDRPEQASKKKKRRAPLVLGSRRFVVCGMSPAQTVLARRTPQSSLKFVRAAPRNNPCRIRRAIARIRRETECLP